MSQPRPFAILGVFTTIILILFIVFRADKPRFDWKESYDEWSKEPYGLYIAKNLLSDYFPLHDFIPLEDSLHQNLIDTSKTTPANYVFIGGGMYLDSLDVEELTTFVYEGNNAFISSRTLPIDLALYLNFYECDDYAYWEDYYEYFDSTAQLNFLHSDLQLDTGYTYQYFNRNKIRPYRWQYFGDEFFCTSNDTLIALGTVGDSSINFVRTEYGEGYFYLHTTPLAFTNISLLDKGGLEYLQKVFTHLPAGNVYWDEGSRVSEQVAKGNNDTTNRGLPDEHPLQYVLSQPALAWAWYLTLGLGLLYLIFRAKRRQRVIPVLPPNHNTSLEFIQTIGRLNFMQNNHRRLALQQMKLFLNFIRERYHFSMKPSADNFVEKLAIKSDIPAEKIEKLLFINKNINASPYTSEKSLVEFHRLLEDFYQNCK